jgi:hypothetical protein
MAELGTLDVLVRALGAKDTEEDLGNVQKGTKKTAKAAAKDTQTMEKFATRFAGTMAIVTGSMAAAASALLLKAPIISEIGFALGVLVEELAFMIDSVLEPVLTPLIDAIFWLSEKFAELPGPVKTVIAVLVVLAVVVGTIVAVLAILFIGLLSVVGSIITIAGALAAGSVAALVFVIVIGLIVTAITTVAGIILGATIILGLLILTLAAVVLPILLIIAAVWLLVKLFKWAWPYIAQFVKDQIDGMVSKWKAGWDFVVGLAGKLKGWIIDKVKGIGQAIWDAIDLEERFKKGWEAIKTVARGFVDFLKGIGGGLFDTFKGLAGVVVDTLNKVIEGMNSIAVTIPDWVPVYGGKSWSLNIPKIPALEVGGKVTGTGAATVHAGETVLTKQLTDMLEAFFASGGNGGGDIIINIDGQKVAEVVNNYNNSQSSTMGW